MDPATQMILLKGKEKAKYQAFTLDRGIMILIRTTLKLLQINGRKEQAFQWDLNIWWVLQEKRFRKTYSYELMKKKKEESRAVKPRSNGAQTEMASDKMIKVAVKITQNVS